MSAQAQTQPNRRTEVEFPFNVAVTLTMKYAQPKRLPGQHGIRCMYTTADNRVFFLDEAVAAQIEAAGINTNEPFTITRRESGRKGEPAQWLVARLAQAAPQAIGQQSDGTYVVPRDPEAQPAPKPCARAGSAEHVSSLSLAAEAKAAVDAFAEVLEYGLTKHAGKVKPDEIQRLFVSVYIQRRGAA